MFRIDRSTFEFKKDDKPFVLAHDVVPAPLSLRLFPIENEDTQSADKQDDANEIVDILETASIENTAHQKTPKAAHANIEAAEELSDEELSIVNETASEIIINAKLAAQEILDKAREDADNLLKEKKEEADKIIAAAQAEKQTLIAQADAKATAVDKSINDAREEAAKIIADARMQSDDIKLLAQNEGFETGRAEGMNVGKDYYESEIAEIKTRYLTMCEKVEAERLSIADDMEKECLSLSMSIAQKVLKAAIVYDESAFMSLVKDAVHIIKNDGRVTVRVSPEEYYVFFSENSGILSTDKVEVNIVEDASLSSGDLIVESNSEQLDAGVNNQINMISDALSRLEGENNA